MVQMAYIEQIVAARGYLFPHPTPTCNEDTGGIAGEDCNISLPYIFA